MAKLIPPTTAIRAKAKPPGKWHLRRHGRLAETACHLHIPLEVQEKAKVENLDPQELCLKCLGAMIVDT